MFGVPGRRGSSTYMMSLVFFVALVGKLLALVVLIPLLVVVAILYFVAKIIKK